MMFLPAAFAALLVSCSTSTPAPPAVNGPMSMAEMRIAEAGGPSTPARPASDVPAPQAAASPVTTALNAGPLTDAGAYTILGKQWIFTSVDGYDGALPGPPTQAGMMLSRGNGRMVGTTSCNPMSAAFTIDAVAGTLSFRNLTNGSAMCSRQNSDTEDAVTAMLLTVDGFRLEGKTLTLTSKGNDVAVLGTP
jgi:heat shock protein HslJ